jgi:hypothetical protein
MGGLIALAAVEQHLALTQLVLPHVALYKFPIICEQISEERNLHSDQHAGFQIRIESGFNRASGSGSRRAKMNHKSRKKL